MRTPLPPATKKESFGRRVAGSSPMTFDRLRPGDRYSRRPPPRTWHHPPGRSFVRVRLFRISLVPKAPYMIPAALPANEQQRLEDLYSYNILDTAAERDFDELVELAAMICGTDMSLVTLVDRGRQWFKARIGVAASETPRSDAFCAHAILQGHVLVIENALEDERFHDNPLVTGAPHIRFYAGAPIVSFNGFTLGTVCVLDERPRQLDAMQLDALRKLARQASLLLEFRKKNGQLKRILREQLQQRQLAEVASKTQKQFLSTMSHEIRTPLNGVIGMTDLLLAEEPQPHQMEYLRALKFASGHLLTVVNDVLDYNKITSNSLSFEQVDFELPALVQDIVRHHAPTARGKGLKLELSLDATLPETVNGDPARLTQVLHNLLSNALKFTHEGWVRIEVGPGAPVAGRIAVRFAVRDSGIGIAPDKLGAIFEEFGQAHAGINRQFGGSGLGLSISKKILELQGSEIHVQSKPGEGACFFFTLPFAAPAPAAPALAGCTPDETSILEGMRVLVAEDNELNWVVLRKYLQLWGIEADRAADGAEAVALAQAADYEVILMDLQMPVLDGYAATQQLRAEVCFRGPVYAITADAFLAQETDLAALGFTGSVVKPFDRKELCATLMAIRKGAVRSV
ncbi:MAG: hybrid sensor histidine kinase/response regulator [Chitinophagaceae bacterium]|nr:MAG: hybrid sensor histidine kinase/response regulator [Chitinophagaceae bacterium]